MFCANAALAHPEFTAATTNRYLKLDLVGADQIRLAYTIMYGAGPALAERKRADQNADGRLDENETRTIGERLRDEVSAHLKLTLDGQPLTLSFDPPSVGLLGSEVGPAPFSVDLLAHLQAEGAGPHTLLLNDETELPQLGESEIRIEESPSTRLIEAHRGASAEAGRREGRILFRGPKFSLLEDRSVLVRFEGVARPAQTNGRPAKTVGLIVVGTLALLALLWGILRRYRNMNG
jgi:hypothetical protein